MITRFLLVLLPLLCVSQETNWNVDFNNYGCGCSSGCSCPNTATNQKQVFFDEAWNYDPPTEGVTDQFTDHYYMYPFWSKAPATAAAATAQGYAQVMSCEGNPYGLGNVYAPDPDNVIPDITSPEADNLLPTEELKRFAALSTWIIYDDLGQIAGHMDVFASNPDLSQYVWYYKFEALGQTFFAVITYLNNPFNICMNVRKHPTTPTGFYSDRLWHRKGNTWDLVAAPLTLKEALSSNGGAPASTLGNCFAYMGYHTMPGDYTTNLCSFDFFPISYLYYDYHQADRDAGNPGRLVGWLSFVIDDRFPYPSPVVEATAGIATAGFFNLPMQPCLHSVGYVTSVHHWYIPPIDIPVDAECDIAVRQCGNEHPVDYLVPERTQTFTGFMAAGATAATPQDFTSAVQQYLQPGVLNFFWHGTAWGNEVWHPSQNRPTQGGGGQEEALAFFAFLTKPQFNRGWLSMTYDVDPANPAVFVGIPGQTSFWSGATAWAFGVDLANTSAAPDELIADLMYGNTHAQHCAPGIQGFNMNWPATVLAKMIEKIPTPEELCPRVVAACPTTFVDTADCVSFYSSLPVAGCGNEGGWFKGNGRACRFVYLNFKENNWPSSTQCSALGRDSSVCVPEACLVPPKMM